MKIREKLSKGLSNMASFWKDGLSLRESKMTVLLLAFIATIVVALRGYIVLGDFTYNMLELLKIMVIIIGGVNAATSIANTLNGNNKDKQPKG